MKYILEEGFKNQMFFEKVRFRAKKWVG